MRRAGVAAGSSTDQGIARCARDAGNRHRRSTDARYGTRVTLSPPSRPAGFSGARAAARYPCRTAAAETYSGEPDARADAHALVGAGSHGRVVQADWCVCSRHPNGSADHARNGSLLLPCWQGNSPVRRTTGDPVLIYSRKDGVLGIKGGGRIGLSGNPAPVTGGWSAPACSETTVGGGWRRGRVELSRRLHAHRFSRLLEYT